MIRELFSTTILVVMYGLPCAANATPLTFEELVREALATSPEAAKIDATLSERAAEAFTTKVKDNPVLSAGVDIPLDKPDEGREDPELALSLSQALRPSDFGARDALSTLIRDTADSEKVLALNEFIQNLSVLYTRAWQSQATEQILSDGRLRAQQVLKKVSGGANKGLFPEGDIELLKAEVKSFEAQAVAARSELARTLAELTRLAGISLADRQLVKPSDDLSLTKEALIQLVKESKLPIQRRYELLRRLSEKQLEVARLDSFPAVSPALGYARHDDGTSQVTFGFSVPLPLFNRNEGEKIRAEGALALAKRNEAYATSSVIESEASLLFEALGSVKEQIALFESGVLPAKRRAVDAYIRQFDAGTGSIFQLWQAQRELNESHLQALELQSAFASTKAQINALTGQQQF